MAGNYSSKMETEWGEFKVVHSIKDSGTKLMIQILNAQGTAKIGAQQFDVERWSVAFVFDGRPARLTYFSLDHWELVAGLVKQAQDWIDAQTGTAAKSDSAALSV
jgi:hypothetical protein